MTGAATRVDRHPARLAGVIEQVRQVLAAAVAADAATAQGPLRGLHLAHADVVADLERPFGTPRFGTEPGPLADAMRGWSPGALVASLCDLDDFDLAVTALALAPELDERFGTAIAWLHEDLARRRPTPLLALHLFATSADEFASNCARFASGAPLCAGRVLAPTGSDLPVLSRPMTLDDQMRRLLLGEPGLDQRLAPWCRLLVPAEQPPLGPPLDALVARAAADADGGGDASDLRLSLGGRPGMHQQLAAAAIAAARSCAVLRVDLGHLATLSPVAARTAIDVLAREALLLGAVLDLAPADVVREPGNRWLETALTALVTTTGGPVVLRNEGAGAAVTLPGADLLPVEFDLPPPPLRRARWADAAARLALPLAADELDTLGRRYRLSLADIDTAARQAAAGLRWSLGESDPFRACAAQARACGGRRLAVLARCVVPKVGWDDLVLPPSVEQQLRELCARAGVHDRVLDEWGFGAKSALGRGLAALFAGPSGTGKSMAAEVVAGALGLDLFRVNLATVVDKYIGETEKNLDAVFQAAQDASGILLFDEADALFGRRSEVRDAHDRYANLEVAYLLQRMEEHEGLTILSTNLDANLDDAFTRRFAAIVRFPFPEPGERARLWRKAWPPDAAPATVDADRLAERFALSGGGIRSATLAAAGFAAADGGTVTVEHVRLAVRREFEKLGRSLTSAELSELEPRR